MYICTSYCTAQVKEAAKEVFEISEDKECRLWHRYMTSHYEQVKGQLLSDCIAECTCCLATTLILQLPSQFGLLVTKKIGEGVYNKL